MRILILICFVISLGACHDKNTLPGNILKKDKMGDVLWDIMQADAFTNSFIKKDPSKNPVSENIRLQKQIFSIYGISKEDFYTSYTYYKEHPSLMLVVLDSITAKETRIENIQSRAKINHAAMLDSIKMRAIANRTIQLKTITKPPPVINNNKPKPNKKKTKHSKPKINTNTYQ